MNELMNMDRVGITKRSQPQQRRRTTAPAPVSATLAAMLGATSPAVADAGHVRIKTSEVRSAVGTLPTAPAAFVVSPSKIDALETPVAQTLAESLAFAEIVHRTMPIDEEMNRRAESALSRHIKSQPSRKLARK